MKMWVAKDTTLGKETIQIILWRRIVTNVIVPLADALGCASVPSVTVARRKL